MKVDDIKTLINLANEVRDRYNEHVGCVEKTCQTCGQTWIGMREEFDHPNNGCAVVALHEVMGS